MKEVKQDQFKATDTFTKENDKGGDMVPPTPTPFHKKKIFSWQKRRSVALQKYCVTATIL